MELVKINPMIWIDLKMSTNLYTTFEWNIPDSNRKPAFKFSGVLKTTEK